MSRRVCTVGIGHVGLVTAAGLAALGHDVVGVDVDRRKVDALSSGRVPFHEDQLPELVAGGIRSGRLRFTTSLAHGLSGAACLVVCVGTPDGLDCEPDASQVLAIADEAGALLNGYTEIVVKSTVPLGGLDAFAKRLRTRIAPGASFELICCPEFLAEGSAVRDFFHPSRIVLGADTEPVARRANVLFDGIEAPRVYTSIVTAQLIKYASNALLASRVALANEVAWVCEALRADVHAVVQAVLLDPRCGGGYLRPGIGFGGPCLEKDLRALIFAARAVGQEPLLLAAIEEQNHAHLERVAGKIRALAPAVGHIAVMGLSFKPGTDDVRNSLPLAIVRRLADSGYKIRATDPHACATARTELTRAGVEFVADPFEASADSDVQAFLTAWPDYADLDLSRLREVVRQPSIFDGPGIFDPNRAMDAGFDYAAIGRPTQAHRVLDRRPRSEREVTVASDCRRAQIAAREAGVREVVHAPMGE